MGSFLIELIVRGVVLCLLTAMSLLVLQRTPAAYRHLICVLALCAFLVLPLAQRLLPPLVLRIPQSAPTPDRITMATEAGSPVADRNAQIKRPSLLERPSKPVIHSKPASPFPQDSAPNPHHAANVEAESHQERSSITTAVLLAVWGIGAATFLVRLLVALFRLRRLEAQSRKAILGSVPILVSDEVVTPLTWGIHRSVILLPARLLSGDRAVCDSALRHEQAHIARWDWLWNLLAECICALCWFQPGVWWLRGRMRLESERACDDRVLVSGIAGPDYATYLLEIARSVGTSEVAPAMAQSRGLEERMRYILDGAKPRQAQAGWLAASAVFALALLSLAALRVSARPAETILPTHRSAATMDPATPLNPHRSSSPPSGSADLAPQSGTTDRANAPQGITAPAAPLEGNVRSGATATQEPDDIAWGPGRDVQAGLRARLWAAPQHASRFIFDVYLCNRTTHSLSVNCPGFVGLSVPTDAGYTTMLQSPFIYCTPHLRDGNGKRVDIRFRLAAEDSQFTVEPGQVVNVSHWMLRTMNHQAKDARSANYTQVAFVASGKHRMVCDVSASWGGGKRTRLRTGEATFDVTGDDVGSEEVKTVTR